MTNPLSGITLSQIAAQAHNQFGSAYNQYAQQGMNQHMAAQQAAYNINTQRPAWNAAWHEQRWKIDGKYMSLQEFVDFIWPEDCPDKTFFLLKHTKETGND